MPDNDNMACMIYMFLTLIVPKTFYMCINDQHLYINSSELLNKQYCSNKSCCSDLLIEICGGIYRV